MTSSYEKMNTSSKISELINIIFILHELKHKGKLPKELDKYRDFIETFNPENWRLK